MKKMKVWTKEEVLKLVPESWDEECTCGWCNTTHSWRVGWADVLPGLITIGETLGNGSTAAAYVLARFARVGHNEWVEVRK
jgi:acetylornithine/succinyldiaminopimelate/putrescine aminotransferase